jgi:hypothetical protein
MELSICRPNPQKPKPPPLWFVTNGELTVGPVRTGLLLRGVEHERIPDYCAVRELRWKNFRGLDEIREIRALRTRFAQSGTSGSPAPSDEFSTILATARDPGEVLLLGMHAAIEKTRASIGLVHRIVDPWAPPITCCVHGTGLIGRLGEKLPRSDLMLGAARARRIVIGDPLATAVHRDGAMRLSAGYRTLSGIAMLPICRGNELLAMIELARDDHTFREKDDLELANLARAMIERLDALAN